MRKVAKRYVKLQTALLEIGSSNEVNEVQVAKAQESKKALLDKKSSPKIKETTIWDIALFSIGSSEEENEARVIKSEEQKKFYLDEKSENLYYQKYVWN